jgi:hypothetical protein
MDCVRIVDWFDWIPRVLIVVRRVGRIVCYRVGLGWSSFHHSRVRLPCPWVVVTG